ncbi:hypothetical protein ACQPWW_13130 [Micromonospora sp. CA-240977]|uniref:hypothetical protein n=1 Tax=Micromonospora sp. CA-240977 TaxID=3239957 RepID=UPI003D92CC98
MSAAVVESAGQESRTPVPVLDATRPRSAELSRAGRDHATVDPPVTAEKGGVVEPAADAAGERIDGEVVGAPVTVEVGELDLSTGAADPDGGLRTKSRRYAAARRRRPQMPFVIRLG